jgi:sugar/nucleoside kinase (ribokinase family)
VAIVGVTGGDFPVEALDRLAARGVDVSGVMRLPHPTFRWHARYDASGNREVLSVHRGAIVRAAPTIPPPLRNPEILFLGSAHPSAQLDVLEQAETDGLVVLDTMPRWIQEDGPDLRRLLGRTDVLLANDVEIRILAGLADEAKAAETLRSLGPTWVVAKRGARGACAYGEGECVEVDAVRVENVVDPTGAGDAFAGGMVASLAATRSPSAADMRAALEVGAVMGARAVSAFSFEGLMVPEPLPRGR